MMAEYAGGGGAVVGAALVVVVDGGWVVAVVGRVVAEEVAVAEVEVVVWSVSRTGPSP